jgi:endonuclease YncB( thermonuclease family)
MVAAARRPDDVSVPHSCKRLKRATRLYKLTSPLFLSGIRHHRCESYRVKIRICGIDAPESGQPGSREAWEKLLKIVHGKTVTCVQVNSRPPGTVLRWQI